MTTDGDAAADGASGFLYAWEGLLLRARVGSNVKLVGWVLRTHGNANGTSVRPSLATLVMETEMSYDVVKRARAVLIKIGLIVLVKRGNRRRGIADEYRLAIPDDFLERAEVLSPAEIREGAIKIKNERRMYDDDRIVRRNQKLAESHQGAQVPPDEGDQGAPVPPIPDFQGAVVPPEKDDQGAQESPRTRSTGQGRPLYPVSGGTTAPPPSFKADQPPTETNPDHLPADPSLAPLPSTAGQNGHVVQLVMKTGQNVRPGKCEHGLPNTTRPDGQPACAHCRRGIPAARPPIDT